MFIADYAADILDWDILDWDILDRRVSSRVPPPNTIAQMQEALGEEWENLPQQDIRRLVHSMRKLVTALIQANCGHTRY